MFCWGGQATGLIPKSHKNIHQHQSLFGSRFLQNYKLNSFDGKSQVLFVKQPKGSLLLFDTNGWHRACYDAPVRRQFIEFGFADRLKSDELGSFTSIAHSPNQVPRLDSYPSIFDLAKMNEVGGKIYM